MAKKQEPKEKEYKFKESEYLEWKDAGTNTGIVKDFTTWLEEKQ